MSKRKVCADALVIVNACTHNVAIGCKAACAVCITRGILALEQKFDALEDRAQALEEGLSRYGKHDVKSPWNPQCEGVNSKGCVCGLSTLLTTGGEG